METAEVAPRIIRIQPPSLNSILSVAVIASVVLWRAWAALQWTFQGDDWAWISDAARMPFLEFVTRQANGHLQPGQFALVWLVTKVAPLNYFVAITPLLAAMCVAGILMWKFLAALFGDRLANLVPLAVFMLCPLSMPPALWWASGLGTIPLQLFIVASLFAVLRYVRAPSTGRLAAVALTYGGAVLFWEKALLILPLVAVFVLLFLGEGSGRERLLDVTVGRWPLWTVLGGITAAYAWWYLTAAAWQLTYRAPVLQIGQLARTAVGITLIPTYLGGPWSASPWGTGFVSELSSPMKLLAWGAALAVVASSLVLRRQAWRAWTLLLVYVGLCILLVASSRLRIIGPAIGLGARYFADSVPVLAVSLALAFMAPLERRADQAWARRVLVLDRASAEREAPQGAEREPLPQWGSPSFWRNFVIGVVIAYAVSALVTSTRVAGLADRDSEKTWFATVRSELAAHPTASVFDHYLPAKAIQAVLFPEPAKASRALAPIAPRIRWDAPAETPLIFDDQGRLRPVWIAGATSARPGPVAGCGYLANRVATTAVLERHLFAWDWGVQLSYFTNRGGSGYVTIDGDLQPVMFLRGLRSVTLSHHGTASLVTIQTDFPVCVTHILVGVARPSG